MKLRADRSGRVYQVWNINWPVTSKSTPYLGKSGRNIPQFDRIKSIKSSLYLDFSPGLKIRVSVVQFHPWPYQIFYFPTTCNQAVPRKSGGCAVFVP
jgi:hypothetical protein